jgi:hypothetical protein
MNTTGHSQVHGGLRGHSIGEIYPFLVVGVGNPFDEEAFHWVVKDAKGNTRATTKCITLAHTIARYLKSIEG